MCLPRRRSRLLSWCVLVISFLVASCGAGDGDQTAAVASASTTRGPGTSSTATMTAVLTSDTSLVASATTGVGVSTSKGSATTTSEARESTAATSESPESTIATSNTQRTSTSTATTTATTDTRTMTTQPAVTKPLLGEQRVEVNGVLLGPDTSFDSSQVLILWPLKAVAIDTNLPVELVSARPADKCALAPPDIQITHGSVGDVCIVSIHVDGTNKFAPVDTSFKIRLVSSRYISWTLRSGPPQSGCFAPGAKLDDIVMEALNGSSPFHLAGGPVDGAHRQLLMPFDVERSETKATITPLQISPNAPLGTTIVFRIGPSGFGTGLVTGDPAMVFEWLIGCN